VFLYDEQVRLYSCLSCSYSMISGIRTHCHFRVIPTDSTCYTSGSGLRVRLRPSSIPVSALSYHSEAHSTLHPWFATATRGVF
jgi:hypothetical protein